MLSVVIPGFNEEGNVEKTALVISDILSQASITYELIFVDDGSKDGTWSAIQKMHSQNTNIKGIKFSRNFGKESAIFAGLKEAKGDCVVVIDCDLQHPPEKILEMYRLWEDGYEIVEGIKADRGKEGAAYSFAAKCFYDIFSNAAGTDLRHASDFKLLDRKAVNALINMPEKNTFFRALSSWVGFRSTQVEYDVREREAGETKWSTKTLTKYAIDNITSFTSAPMQIVTILGFIVFVVGLGASIEAIVTFFEGKAQDGFTTVIILECFTGSFIMMALGIIGYYISKIYDEVKGRPKFIIDKTV